MAKILPQGTQLYALAPTVDNPAVFEVLKVPCAVSIDFGEDSRDEHEDTCLEDLESHTFLPGLNTPGTSTFSVRVDPQSPAHVRLDQLNDSGRRFMWAIGWSDGFGIDPTQDADEPGQFDLPATRTWNVFLGHITGFNITGFEVAGEPLQAAVSIKRSSKPRWVIKTENAPVGP